MKFIMQAGLPGSGKTLNGKKIAEEENAFFFSMDSIREDLYGLSKDSIRHNIMHIVFDYISSNLDHRNVVFEATNKTVKSRKKVLDFIEKNFSDCEKILNLYVEYPEVLIERVTKRSDYVGEDVIWEMLKQFQPPSFEEGWDVINIYTSGNVCINNFLLNAEDINQNNPHHRETLGAHCRKMGDAVQGNHLLKVAAYIHDIGKIYTTIVNKKGYNSFYNHENAGSYISLMLNGFDINELLYISNIICYHSYPYNWTDKKKNKLLKQFGESFINDLNYLNELDKVYA